MTRHGSLLGKPALGKVKEAALEKMPCRTRSDQHQGSRSGHGGLSSTQTHSCLRAPAWELSRLLGWFSCQQLGAFKRAAAAHWLSSAPRLFT